jgi:hypothetical protein
MIYTRRRVEEVSQAMKTCSELRRIAPAGSVTIVSYDGLKFLLDCGIEAWDYAETWSLQAVIRDHGTPAQKQRLQEEILASRWSTELMVSQ